MHQPSSPDSQSAQLHEIQTALFALRDGLMNLKLSLLDLASVTDEQARHHAQQEVESLFQRLKV